LSLKGEFWDRLERALDLSKIVSEPEKNEFPLGARAHQGFKRHTDIIHSKLS
jgi:hypothetical protein